MVFLVKQHGQDRYTCSSMAALTHQDNLLILDQKRFSYFHSKLLLIILRTKSDHYTLDNRFLNIEWHLKSYRTSSLTYSVRLKGATQSSSTCALKKTSLDRPITVPISKHIPYHFKSYPYVTLSLPMIFMLIKMKFSCSFS